MRWALVVTIGAGVALWSTPGRALCSKDVDCKGDRLCSAGTCQAPPPRVTRNGSTTASAPTVRAPRYRRHNKAMMITGIIMTSVGTASLLTGAGLTIAEVSCRNHELEHHSRCEDFETAALATLLGGFAFASIGVPLILHGGKKIPIEAEGASIAPWLARGSAGLSLRLRLN
jgi:hypothetical protein